MKIMNSRKAHYLSKLKYDLTTYGVKMPRPTAKEKRISHSLQTKIEINIVKKILRKLNIKF